jgi:hypothetical protein
MFRLSSGWFRDFTCFTAFIAFYQGIQATAFAAAPRVSQPPFVFNSRSVPKPSADIASPPLTTSTVASGRRPGKGVEELTAGKLKSIDSLIQALTKRKVAADIAMTNSGGVAAKPMLRPFAAAPAVVLRRPGLAGAAISGAGYDNVRPLTIDHTKVPNSDQISFPVLVLLDRCRGLPVAPPPAVS